MHVRVPCQSQVPGFQRRRGGKKVGSVRVRRLQAVILILGFDFAAARAWTLHPEAQSEVVFTQSGSTGSQRCLLGQWTEPPPPTPPRPLLRPHYYTTLPRTYTPSTLAPGRVVAAAIANCQKGYMLSLSVRHLRWAHYYGWR